MRYDFDEVRERRGTDSIKWGKYAKEVIPLWVADMDFVSAKPIIEALHRRVEHGFFGYCQIRAELCSTIQERMRNLYAWETRPEEIFHLPGIVVGLNLSFQAFSNLNDGILISTPVYPHFIKDPVAHGRALADPPLVRRGDAYEVDFDAFEKAITEQTKIFILCNPHNPVGRVFTRNELEKMAAICLRHRLLICSDEIHCDLLFPGHSHIPIASLAPEVAERTITFMAPSKTFNLPGLNCGFAIIQNPALQEVWKRAIVGLVPSINIMGQAAALAAYREGGEWLEQVLGYLDANRNFLAQYVSHHLPGVSMTRMEGTYLAWLDCRPAGLPQAPQEFFLQEAGVALNEGAEFGRGGEGFVRLNFACPRKTLQEALERMSTALKKIQSGGVNTQKP